uniref:Fos-related antigen 2-like n=1 Tax=Saccoglossus kowalevskii TaxID=10224 RepID=A0ABM0H095_SACKO|nr:PREDICTED: fos-related antigen 2-like [Saccoglossus kowalevskii]
MYNTPSTSQPDSNTTNMLISSHDDTQFIVADVLSSMASGLIPADAKDYTESDDLMDISTLAPSLQTNATTFSTLAGTTPTGAPSNSSWMYNQINTIPNDNFIHGGGFTPPVITTANNMPVLSQGLDMSSRSSSRSNCSSPASVVSEGSSLLGKTNLTLTGPLRRRISDKELDPSERVKRKVRRERNKVAAAKCRQKRVDQTNTLVGETEEWEEKNRILQNEIAKLEKQKEQLQFLLQAHKPMCKIAQHSHSMLNCPSTDSYQAATTFATTFSKSSILQTPTTEVVTPTSSMFTFPLELPSSSLMMNTSCGSEVTKDS